ncbi:peptide deformylase [Selenomonas sp. oral taxon 138 str. F0429]|nr:peptide deformylase [Selenomonas sp. oral taxon 138 str. F0429]
MTGKSRPLLKRQRTERGILVTRCRKIYLFNRIFLKQRRIRQIVRSIVKDAMFLGQPSEEAVKSDLPIANDLLDTLKAHVGHCVGLAANMIGEKKRIIAVCVGKSHLVMLNPEIVKASSEQYEAEEGCLSLPGQRKTMRHEWVEVTYRDIKFRKQQNKFSGFTAQIIQHEIDHCNGVLI